MNWRFIKAALLLLAIYFPVALYLRSTYVPSADPAPNHWLRYPPYPRLAGIEEGHAYVAWLDPAYDEIADDEENPRRSPLLLFEDGKLLGPAHSDTKDIKDLGRGRYVHRKGLGLIFSPSDNGDPNGPWKRYWVEPDLKSSPKGESRN
jgi:hypothetical protein